MEVHGILKNFSKYRSFEILDSEETAIRFAEEVGLIPSPRSTPPHHCGVPMKIKKIRHTSLGWVWECAREKGRKVKGRKMCRATINPAVGTVLEERICMGNFLAIVFSFVMACGVNEAYRDLNDWRRGAGFSKKTIVKYYKRFRHAMKIVLSNENLVIGGLGKTVEIDETFVTRHKYHRGRRTKAMTLTVLGLHCREDKSTLFFPVDTKSKRDLWPYIRRYVDAKTNIICTDKAKQYIGIEKIFVNAEHKSTNHSIGEFVGFKDSSNTINSLENQNRLLKRSLKSRRSREHIQTYIDAFIYRSRKFHIYKDDYGSQIQLFLNDLIRIHPPYVNGVKACPLRLVRSETPTVETERLGNVLPVAFK